MLTPGWDTCPPGVHFLESIAESAEAACCCASCPLAYAFTPTVTPSETEINVRNPTRNRVNEPTGVGFIPLLYNKFHFLPYPFRMPLITARVFVENCI